MLDLDILRGIQGCLVFLFCLIFDGKLGAELSGVEQDLDFEVVVFRDNYVDVFLHFINDFFSFFASVGK